MIKEEAMARVELLKKQIDKKMLVNDVEPEFYKLSIKRMKKESPDLFKVIEMETEVRILEDIFNLR